LNKNKLCNTGLFGTKKALYFEKGPSGDKEVIAFICDDGYSGYWYGQICRLATQDVKFVAVLAWLTKFVNAYTPEKLLDTYHYTTLKQLEYVPYKTQSPDDGIRISDSFENAVLDLAEIIKKFDIKKRAPDEDSEYYKDPTDLETLSLYGLNNPMFNRLICPDFE
jgi:hypothetical protein